MAGPHHNKEKLVGFRVRGGVHRGDRLSGVSRTPDSNSGLERAR